MAIRVGGKGDVTGTHKVWDIPHGSEVGTPVHYGGHLYWANEESGIVYCVKASNGEVVYKERLQPRPGRIYASGVVADGKLYYVSRENGTYVLPAAPSIPAAGRRRRPRNAPRCSAAWEISSSSTPTIARASRSRRTESSSAR